MIVSEISIKNTDQFLTTCVNKGLLPANECVDNFVTKVSEIVLPYFSETIFKENS